MRPHSFFRRLCRIGCQFVCCVVLMMTAQRGFAEVRIDIDAPMAPPSWALMERELLRANTAACKAFFARYFDERGFLQCVERWGGDDGPDDAIENCTDWPILHALGASDEILQLYKKAYEGHVRQYTLAKTTDVPLARDGMYYREFPVMFDWVHNGEGLTVFNLQGLSDVDDARYRQRVRRFAGFYMNEEPQAPNYDPEHKIIKSLFNGSRGPLLRKATGLDWAGDPIEIEGRFELGHQERNYAEMVAHFKDYNDIVGDHPLNLLATNLVMNAYMATQEEKYRKWLLEYVNAWRDRMAANGDIIPTNIGLDGKIGGACNGKWYGGVYGWAFTVEVPQTKQMAHRNQHAAGFRGFINAYVLTGDDRYLDAWRKQIDKVNAQKKTVDGKTLYPHMYGDDGWYDYTPEKYNLNVYDIYYLSMAEKDRERLPPGGWLDYLSGKNPAYPEQALQADLERIRVRAAGARHDKTTPDTRLADDPLKYNPASVQSLNELMQGGIHPGITGSILNCRLRYFDPIHRRAGIPEDVGALVEQLSADETTLVLVNTNQLEERTVVIQGGAYAEHQFVSVQIVGDTPRSGGSGKPQDIVKTVPIKGSTVTIRLAPGAGERLVLRMKRYANKPTLAFPWNRG